MEVFKVEFFDYIVVLLVWALNRLLALLFWTEVDNLAVRGAIGLTKS